MSNAFQLALGNNTPTTVSAVAGRIDVSDPGFLLFGGGTPGQVLTTDGNKALRWAGVSTAGADAPSDGHLYGRYNANWSQALPIGGGTLIGPLVLANDPVGSLEAVTKQYVDNRVFVDAPNDTFAYGRVSLGWGRVLPLAGGTMTGPLVLAGAPTVNLHPATKLYVDTADNLKAPLASPVFTGDPQAPTPATADNDTSIATTAFVKAQNYTTGGPYAPLASPTFTGVVTTPGWQFQISGGGSAQFATGNGATFRTNTPGNSFQFQIASSANVLVLSDTTSNFATSNAIRISNSRSGNPPTIAPTGGIDANCSMVLQAAGTGTVQAPTMAAADNSTAIATTAFVAAALAAALPPGAISAYAAAAAPAGWLLCNGQLVSRATYAALFTAIGTTYGIGDGSTTFALPDLRGRVPAGLDPTNTTGRLTASAAGGVSAAALGNNGGEQGHVITQAELAAHGHGVNETPHTHGITQSGHVHGGVASFDYVSQWVVGGGQWASNQATSTAAANATVSVNNASTGVTIQSTGGGAQHNNAQPSLIVNWIIKT